MSDLIERLRPRHGMSNRYSEALTELNTRKICELAGRPDAKVFAGASEPIARKLVTAEHVHGKTRSCVESRATIGSSLGARYLR